MWKATFTNDAGNKVIDTFVLENGQLWLDTVMVAGKTFNGDKSKMTKCR